MEYPGRSVIEGERVVGYLSAALSAGVWATRQQVNSDAYRAVHGYDEIPVNMEAPMEGQSYPYIHVMYQDNGFQPLSIEEGRYGVSDGAEGEPSVDRYSIYKFSGRYVVNVYATTILERECITDCLIGALGIDDSYRNLFYENPYLSVSPNMHTLSSPSARESWGTPWDADAMTAFRQLSFDVVGEFVYRVGTDARYISKIEFDQVVRTSVDAELNHDGSLS